MPDIRMEDAAVAVRKIPPRRLIGNAARIFILGLLIVFYGLSLRFGLTEESRRSLRIAEATYPGDSVLLDIRVTGIDTTKGLLFERIRMVPMGTLAVDRSTPARDLTLLLNSVSGQQTVSFPKGHRIEPIDATTVLIGDSNKYPFDVYRADIDALVSVPAQRKTDRFQIGALDWPTDSLDAEGLMVGAGDLSHTQPIPISENVTASIPQFKFKGTVARDGPQMLTHTHISSRRANSVVMTSIGVMTTMLVLALSVAAMVVRATRATGKMDILPLSLSISLIFGLPALRNTQPNVPGVGVLGDYVSFIWASFIVSFSAIALIWIWILRTKAEQRAQRFERPKS